MPEVHSKALSSWEDVQDLPADRILVLLGGVSAIALGVLAFLLTAATGLYVDQLGALTNVSAALLTFVIVLVFGTLLVWAFTVMGRDLREGSGLAVAFSVVLIAFGSIAGAIAGVLGLIGSGLALWRLWWGSHH